jgi:hypothetical protein
MNRKWLATDLGWRDYPEHSQICRDVREIFSSGTVRGLCPVRRNISSVDGHSIRRNVLVGYQNYAPADPVLEGLEREAQAGRKGLWADPQPVLP